MKLPFYEFMDFRMTLDEELKAEAEEAKKQENESKSMNKNMRMPNMKTPKFKK